jgi:hypothetical protein
MCLKNIFACFEMPPEVAVIQWQGGEEKRVSKDVHSEYRAESLIHEWREAWL